MNSRQSFFSFFFVFFFLLSLFFLRWHCTNISFSVFPSHNSWCWVWLSSSVKKNESVCCSYKLWQAAMDLDWIHETWLNREKQKKEGKKPPIAVVKVSDSIFLARYHTLNWRQWWWTLISTEILFVAMKPEKPSVPFLKWQLNIARIFHRAPRFSFRLSFNNCFYSFAANYLFPSYSTLSLSLTHRSMHIYNIQRDVISIMRARQFLRGNQKHTRKIAENL